MTVTVVWDDRRKHGVSFEEAEVLVRPASASDLVSAA